MYLGTTPHDCVAFCACINISQCTNQSFVVQNRFTDALMAYRNETSKDYRSDVNGFIDFFQRSVSLSLAYT